MFRSSHILFGLVPVFLPGSVYALGNGVAIILLVGRSWKNTLSEVPSCLFWLFWLHLVFLKMGFHILFFHQFFLWGQGVGYIKELSIGKNCDISREELYSAHTCFSGLPVFG